MGLTRRELMQGVGAITILPKGSDAESLKESESKEIVEPQFTLALMDWGKAVTEQQPFQMGFTSTGLTNSTPVAFEPFQMECVAGSFRIYLCGDPWFDAGLILLGRVDRLCGYVDDIVTLKPKALRIRISPRYATQGSAAAQEMREKRQNFIEV